MKISPLSILPYISFFLLALALAACTGPNKQNIKTLPKACTLKPQTGPCRAAFRKYYFSVKENTCKQFIWGGCKGTVPFDTETQCKSACISR